MYGARDYEKTECQNEIIQSLIPENQPESLGSLLGFWETGGDWGPWVATDLEGSSEGVGGGRSCGVGMVAGSNGFEAAVSGKGDGDAPATALSRTFF